MSRRVVPDTDPVWRALGDPTRRQILDLLRGGPMTTGAITAEFPTTRFTVMGHLQLLADAGLVTVERRGRERLNHLNPVPLQQLHERWVVPLAQPSAAVLLRLAEAAEGDREDDEGSGMDTARGLGLDTRAQHLVAVERPRVWRTLLRLAEWWPSCWEDDEQLLFEPWAGGRIGVSTTDAFGTDASLWGFVRSVREARELTVDGPMGIRGPVVGEWTLSLESVTRGTRVTVEHRVLGHVDDEVAQSFASRWPGTLQSLAAAAQRA